MAHLAAGGHFFHELNRFNDFKITGNHAVLTRVIRNFFKSKSVDEPLAERIKDAKTIGDFADIVAESGYELTNDDFNSGLVEILDEALSEDDLDQVAGGGFIVLPPSGNSCAPGPI